MPPDPVQDRAKREAFTAWWVNACPDLTRLVRHNLSRQFGGGNAACQQAEDALQSVCVWILRSEPAVFAAITSCPPVPPHVALVQAISRVVRSKEFGYQTRRTPNGRRERRHGCPLEHNVPAREGVVEAVLLAEAHEQLLKSVQSLPDDVRHVYVEVRLKGRPAMEVMGELSMGKTALYEALREADRRLAPVIDGL